jgi:hypothetical protein
MKNRRRKMDAGADDRREERKKSGILEENGNEYRA